MKNRFIILIVISIMFVSGCSSYSNISESGYIQLGEAFAEIIMKQQKDNTDKSESDSLIKTDSLMEAEKEVITEGINAVLNTSLNNNEQDLEIAFIKILNQDRLKEETGIEVYPYLDAAENMTFIAVFLRVGKQKDETISVKEWIRNINPKLIVDNQYLYTPVQTLLESDLTSMKLEMNEEGVEGFLAFHLPIRIAEESNEMRLLLTHQGRSQILNIR